MDQTDRTRRRRRIVAGLIALVCLLTLGCSFLLSMHYLPGVARMVYGDPPTATAVAAASAPATTSITDGATRPATPKLSTPTSTAQWLAFETKRGSLGDYEIFVIKTDGTRLTNLTSNWADDVAPVWSPTGQRIAFVSLRDTTLGKWGLGPGSIYLVEFDPAAGNASALVRLTDGTSDDGWPTWSPDGKRIAFQSDRGGDIDIWVINTDGTGRMRLTDSPGKDEHPAWSPDGAMIAFTSQREGNRDIWVMQADGSDPANLTQTPSRDRYPMWSPDGTRIAFNSNRDGDQEIYIMNADGSDQVNVTRSPDSIEGLADWSPDGKRLVLYSDRAGHKDIYVLDLSTGQWTPVTEDPFSNEFCTWSP